MKNIRRIARRATYWLLWAACFPLAILFLISEFMLSAATSLAMRFDD